MKIEPTNFTKRFIDGLKFEGTAYLVRDTKVAGLMVSVGARGKVYKIQRDMRRPGMPPRTVRHTLGTADDLSVDQAREKAQEVIAGIKRGVDPNHPVAPAPAPSVWTVERMFDEYAVDLAKRDKAERTIADLHRLLTYLDDWRSLPITSVTKEMCRARHAKITSDNGPVVANQALRQFRTCWNAAEKALDTSPGTNPVDGVTFHKAREGNRSIRDVDLAGWYARVGKLSNPLRRLMHEIGLFSGLRPGNLVALERDWINLDKRAIVIPAEHMKARREFALPLSSHMVDLVKRALETSQMLYPGATWLFPTRSADGSEVICTQVWKEKKLPGETGHMLRHTYSNMARLAGVDDVDRELLLAHKIPGVQGVYLNVPALFGRLLGAQEQVTAHIRALINPQPK